MAFTETFPFEFYVPAVYKRPYSLDVRNNNGELLAKLSRFWDAEIRTAISEPGELGFSILKSDESNDVLTGLDEVWVRDADDAIVGRFRIARREEHVDSSGAWLRIFCRGLLADLAAEPLDEYEADTTISAHVATWFAGQVGLEPVTVGEISTAIGNLSRSVDLSGQESILSAIRGLDGTVAIDTIYWVDSSRRFYWRALSEITDKGFQLRAGHNIQSLTRTVDYDALATRIYARGRNDDGRYVRLSDASGATANYVQSSLTSYTFRRQIIIDHMTVAAAGETDVAFNLVLPSDQHLAEHVSDANTIAFMLTGEATSAITPTINSYTAATGALDCTVTIPTVSGVWDTVLYMVY